MKKISTFLLLMFALLLNMLAADTLLITSETFGTQAYDTDSPVPTTGWTNGTGGYGYKWPAVIGTFTSENGTFISVSSDSTIRVNSYSCSAAPTWAKASGGMQLLLTPPARYTGSWDSAMFSGIDIAGMTNLTLAFGYAKRASTPLDTMYAGVTIKARVDGGSWIELDTSDMSGLLKGDTWKYIVISVPESLEGNTLDILFDCGSKNQIAIDDISVLGTLAPLPPSSIAIETFGLQGYDTDSPVPTTGWTNGSGSYGYKWPAVIGTFTAENGKFISASSDSTIRINSYACSAPQGWAGASGSMQLLLTPPARYSGSWDSVMFSKIYVAKYENLSIAFGWAKRSGATPLDTMNSGITISARIDGGDWVELDTTALSGHKNANIWNYIEIPLPETMTGDTLDILVANGTKNQNVFDDFTIMGSEIPGTYFPIETIVFGKVDDPADYTGSVLMEWDADSVYLTFNVTDDSIFTAGTNYKVDNIEVYLDLDNSKNIHWPRNGGWVSNDPTFDDNDYQLRLVPDSAFSVNNSLGGVNQIYAVNDTGYQFKLNIAWDSLMTGFVPEIGIQIGFDVLISDNDSADADAARNQITMNSSTDKPFNDPSLWSTVEMVNGGYFTIIPDEENPTVPGNITADTLGNDVTLGWDAAEDNIGVLYYIVKADGVDLAPFYPQTSGHNQMKFNDLENGTHRYMIKTVDNNGNQSANSAQKNAIVDVQTVSGLEATEVTFGAYPNPVLSILNISNAEKINRIELVGINGNIINVSANNGADNMMIDVSKLTAGMYILKVFTVDGTAHSSTIIKK